MHSPFQTPFLPRILACALLFLAAATAQGQITLVGPGQISLPPVTVAEHPQTIASGDLTMRLRNRGGNEGWILRGRVIGNAVQGVETGIDLPATLQFKSIRWISGPSKSTAGIAISRNGRRIEADPGFGKGLFEIVFEITCAVPPFPRTDAYQGVTSFTIL